MKNSVQKIIIHGSASMFFTLSIFALIPNAAQAGYYYNDYYDDYHPYPVYTYDNYPKPSPVYYPVYYPIYTPSYSYPNLQASCYPSASSVRVGDSIIWYSSVTGGTGSYSYVWSGTDGLYGYQSSIYKNYYNSGVKSAWLLVTSGNQTASVSCGNNVNVYDAISYYPQPYPAAVQVPVYGQSQSYNVTSNSYTLSSNVNGLDIGCFVDPSNAEPNQPITWSVEVTGGSMPYVYSWTGSDGLSGSQSSIIKYYNSIGNKNAIVSVTSADGKTGTRTCSNSVTVRNAGSASPTERSEQKSAQPSTSQPQQNQPANSSLSAASLFSLSNVPWGWVAILVILVLFATVMYLLFNRSKI